MKEFVMTKLFTVIALIAAFTSPAIGEVVSSKQPGKAHCALNKPDSSFAAADVQSEETHSKKPASGQSAR